MIHSTLYNKNTNEDPKTSTIFEHLLLLPDNIFWSILRNSTRTFKQELPEDIGYLESFEFWPKWNPSKTSNSTYVEPDIFIRFNKLDIIVEAKYQDGGGQYKEEWIREIQAYQNEFSNNKRLYILLAIGGNSDYKDETISSCKILKTNWSDLLDYVTKTKKRFEENISTYEKSSLQRIFNLIISGFHIMGEYEYKKKTNLSAITDIYPLIRMIDDACNKRETQIFSLIKNSEAISRSYYINRFGVLLKAHPNDTIYIGLGIWYEFGEFAIEMDPTEGWAGKLIDMITSNKVFSGKYLDKPFPDEKGKYYIDANKHFWEDFEKAESYDAQLELVQCFIDELIENYIKYL